MPNVYIYHYTYTNVQENAHFTLKAANRMYIDKSYQLANPFQGVLTNKFGEPAQSVDFRTSPEDSRMVINKWVEEFTHSKIKDLLPERIMAILFQLALIFKM